LGSFVRSFRFPFVRLSVIRSFPFIRSGFRSFTFTFPRFSFGSFVPLVSFDFPFVRSLFVLRSFRSVLSVPFVRLLRVRCSFTFVNCFVCSFPSSFDLSPHVHTFRLFVVRFRTVVRNIVIPDTFVSFVCYVLVTFVLLLLPLLTFVCSLVVPFPYTTVLFVAFRLRFGLFVYTVLVVCVAFAFVDFTRLRFRLFVCVCFCSAIVLHVAPLLHSFFLLLFFVVTFSLLRLRFVLR